MSPKSVNEQLLSIYAPPSNDDVMEEHRQAMACRDLEEILGVGELIYSNLRKLHGDWMRDVEARNCPYRRADAAKLASEYARWKEASEYWLPRVESFERNGFTVDHAENVRRFYRELEPVILDVEDLASSYESLERGEGLNLDEFFDALPHSH